MFEKDTIFSDNWINIVFENLNKNYGAYRLRQISKKSLGTAILLTILIFAGSFVIPIVINKVMSGLAAETEVLISKEITLAEPPPIDKNEPPPPPVEPPPPLKSTIKFTPPVIVKDKEVTDEPPPAQVQFEEADAGAKTVEGDSLLGVDPGLVGDGPAEVVPDQVFTIVEQMPSFPGGEAELFKYLGKNIKYPAIAKDNGIAGTVFVQFVVNKEGKVTNAKIVRGIGGGCDEEALRVVNAMPSWKPGKQAGTAVQVMYNLPVKFILR